MGKLAYYRKPFALKYHLPKRIIHRTGVNWLGWLLGASWLLTTPAAAQLYNTPVQTTFLSADTLREKGEQRLTLVAWKYRPGDDPQWASTDFDDRAWASLRPSFYLDSIPKGTWQGVGWFRLRVQIDTLLRDSTLALRLHHNGASEIYWDGRLVRRFGTIGSYQGQEQPYNPNGLPVALPVDHTRPLHTLAIRYANERAQVLNDRYGGLLVERAGFSARVAEMNRVTPELIRETRLYTFLNISLHGILLAFAFLHLMLYLYNAEGKENLWYSAFAGGLSLFFLLQFLLTISHDVELSLLYHLLVNPGLLTFIMVAYVGFLYALFYDHSPRQWPWIIGAAVVLNVASLWLCRSGYLPLASFGVGIFAFVIATTLESVRVIAWAIANRKRDAWLLARGVFMFAAMIALSFLYGLGVLDYSAIAEPFIIGLGLLSVTVITSIYLARKTARTGRNLEVQLMEVQRLGKQSLRQEADKYRLIEMQKQELRTQVEERTRELQETNKNLNQTNEELNVTLEHLRTTQSQLVQSEKMASLGQLTAGVAHEINNPINFVSAGIDSLRANYQDLIGLAQRYFALNPAADNADALAQLAQTQRKLDVPELVAESEQLFKSIKNGASRTTEIVRSLRNFTRLDEQDLKRANLEEGLDSTLTILQNQTKDRVEVVRQYAGIPPINCFPGQLNQVFMNILVNAIQAIEGRGTIHVRTQLLAAAPGQPERIEIRVRDSGQGMPEAVRKRVFEPFFTTKDVGEGTGLGLSISYGIIEKHGGTIRVESAAGQGTEFIIQLPTNLHINQP